jgi:hypothetical protein
MSGAVTVTVAATAATGRVQAELTLLNSSGNTVVVLPITNPAATYTNLAANWAEVDRPGQKPLNMRAGDNLHSMQLNVTLVGADGGVLDSQNAVETLCRDLLNLSQNDGTAGPIALTWGTFDSSSLLTQTGYWHIDDLEIDSTWRQPGTNNVSQATATITLKEVQDPPPATGTAPGWTAPPPPPAPVSASSVNGGKITTWTVGQGDTLYSIATAVYGTPEPGWRTIAAANDISNPASITLDQVLTIPQFNGS